MAHRAERSEGALTVHPLGTSSSLDRFQVLTSLLPTPCLLVLVWIVASCPHCTVGQPERGMRGAAGARSSWRWAWPSRRRCGCYAPTVRLAAVRRRRDRPRRRCDRPRRSRRLRQKAAAGRALGAGGVLVGYREEVGLARSRQQARRRADWARHGRRRRRMTVQLWQERACPDRTAPVSSATAPPVVGWPVPVGLVRLQCGGVGCGWGRLWCVGGRRRSRLSAGCGRLGWFWRGGSRWRGFAGVLGWWG